MVSPIKQYAPLDMTDLNRILNVGDPVGPQDAATRKYVDTSTYQDPMRMPGDTVYESGLGERLVLAPPDQTAYLSGYASARATGLEPGHTIRCACDSMGNDDGGLYLRTFAADSDVAIRDLYVGGLGRYAWTGQTIDVALEPAERAVQFWAGRQSQFRNITYTDLNATAATRLPVGTDGDRYRVSSGVPAWAPEIGTIQIGMDGHGAPPATGVRTDVMVPFDLNLIAWIVIADAVGDLQVDIWRSTLDAYPPTVGGTITGADKPRLSSEQSAVSGELTDWETALYGGDCLRVNLDSVATLTRATVILFYTKA